MKILLLGASGRTGKHILETALQQGHIVHSLVRNKQKIRLAHPNLLLFEGTPADKQSLAGAMQGCEAIINALNISRKNDWPWAGLRTPKDFLIVVAKHIIELAPVYAVNRYIFISAWGVAETKKDIPGWFRWMIDNSNLRYPYQGHEQQEKLVLQSSLVFTAIRTAGLTNFKRKKAVVVSQNNHPKPNLTISRRNLAAFVLEVLEKDLYLNNNIVVSGK